MAILNRIEWGIAGLFGAIAASRFHDDARTRNGFLLFVLTGFLCAHFLTALVTEWFDIPLDSAGGVGFLLGAFGGSLLSAVTRGIKSSDLWSLIRGRLGGGSQ